LAGLLFHFGDNILQHLIPFSRIVPDFLQELFATLSPLLSKFLLQFCQLMLCCGFRLPLNYTGTPNFDRD